MWISKALMIKVTIELFTFMICDSSLVSENINPVDKLLFLRVHK